MCKGTEAQDTGRALATAGTLGVATRTALAPYGHAHGAQLCLARHLALTPPLPTPALAGTTGRMCSALHRPHISLRCLSVWLETHCTHLTPILSHHGCL